LKLAAGIPETRKNLQLRWSRLLQVLSFQHCGTA
jgi:hypothetical protein